MDTFCDKTQHLWKMLSFYKHLTFMTANMCKSFY